jgi:glutamate-ammonia-ligase adenylyltransferase
VGARGATWLLLQESDGVREALVRLFAESAYLSDLLISHPELLDALVLRGRGGERPPRGLEELTAELLPELAARRDAQDAIIALRTFQVAELLRIGLCELSSALPAPGIACPFLSSLGGACVRGADFVAVREMRARHGEPLRADGTPLGRAILALGSLGSGWMTWGSDLDLAFVFEDPEAEGPSGPRDPRTWMPRWAQRVVTGLSTPTPEGRCYGVDLRLRPESGGAPVVVGISGFAAYYRERARPWERIALCRASVVAASDPGMAQRLHATLEEVTRCSPGAGSALVAEAREMRRRQQVEIARESDRRYALKTGTGGLSDVEFAVACLQMTRDPGSPSAFEPDPLRALHTLRDAGAVSPAEHAALAEGYCFLRRAEARLRLRAGQAADALEFPSAASSRVAAALGFPSADALAAGLRRTRASVAAAAGSLLRRAEAGGAA